MSLSGESMYIVTSSTNIIGYLLLLNLVSSENVFQYTSLKDESGSLLCAIGHPDQSIYRVPSAIVCATFCSSDSQCEDFNFSSRRGLCELFYSSESLTFQRSPNCVFFFYANKNNMAVVASQATHTTDNSSPIGNHAEETTTTSSRFAEATTHAVEATTIIQTAPLMQTTGPTAIIPTLGVQSTGPTGLPYPTSGLVPQPSTSILMQNNVNTPNAFNRPWSDFQNGFGDSNGNYWLGNDAMHNYLAGHPYQLHIYLYPVNVVYPTLAIYQWYFLLGDSTSNYQLALSMSGGNATGDGMGKMSNQKFSTFDRDNDVDTHNSCATTFGAGWWYGFDPLNGYACGTTMLNGFGSNFVWARDASVTFTLRACQMWLVY